ncbi:MAG: FAD-dependent oxidoreductase [Evtepia gabavorous]
MAFGQLVLPLPPGGGGAADGCAPTLKELGRLSPYAILDATGGVPGIPAAIQGARESPLVCTPPAVITGALDIREESVVVVGSGMTGLETAELLSDRARNNAVLVLEAAPRLAPGVQGSNRNGVTAVLEVNNVVFLCNRTLTRVGGPDLVCGQPDRGGICLSPTGWSWPWAPSPPGPTGTGWGGLQPGDPCGRRGERRTDLGCRARRLPRGPAHLNLFEKSP